MIHNLQLGGNQRDLNLRTEELRWTVRITLLVLTSPAISTSYLLPLLCTGGGLFSFSQFSLHYRDLVRNYQMPRDRKFWILVARTRANSACKRGIFLCQHRALWYHRWKGRQCYSWPHHQQRGSPERNLLMVPYWLLKMIVWNSCAFSSASRGRVVQIIV